MANIPIKILKDKNENQFVPFTVTDAVFVPDSDETMSDFMNDQVARIDEALKNIPTKTSDLTNDSGFIDNTVNDLVNYSLTTDVGNTIDMSINTTTYVLTLNLKNSSGTVLSTDTVDLPIESMVVNATYDSVNKKIILTLQSGTTIDVPIGDLISGLQSEITVSNKLNADLVDDTNQTNKFVTATDKTNWNAKYDKPGTGIPATDLASAVQTSLGKADTALQSFTETDPVFSSSPAAGITANDIGAWNNKSDFSGSYNDLTNKPTIPDELADLTDDSTHRLVTDTEKGTWNNKSDFCGSYNDLTNTPSIPTKTSDITNDSGFITSAALPTKLSDLTNDNNTVTDASYIHTDNNYTTNEKNKLSGVATGAEVNIIEDIKVNGTSQTVTSKAVNITVPTSLSD